MRCFDVFSLSPYQYLVISRGNVYGNTIMSKKQLMGIFKERIGMEKNGNVENYKSDARIHVKPEDFKENSPKQLIGNGIEYNGQTYQIKDASVGVNFETGESEHWRLDLETAKFGVLEG